MGRPGIARSRAIQKRKETLLQEYKIRNKSNSFVDRRIGEKDAELSAEDKMIARFTMERMKNTGRFYDKVNIPTYTDLSNKCAANPNFFGKFFPPTRFFN